GWRYLIDATILVFGNLGDRGPPKREAAPKISSNFIRGQRMLDLGQGQTSLLGREINWEHI
ncbi:MAG: hypothetical protein OK439_02420, partial [Thaumarchaeota archaeon]|nr:hypothetical protein [Nitrososphaerota archaeon]